MKRTLPSGSSLVGCLTILLAAGCAEAQTLTVTSNLQLWLKADAGVSADGFNVLSWADQSPSADAASQIASAADALSAPTLTANALNGRPAIHFDGINDYLSIPDTQSLSITEDLTTFFVVKFDDFGNYRAVWAKTNSNQPAPTDFYTIPGSGIPQVYRGNGATGAPFASTTALTAGTFLVAGFGMEGTTCSHFLGSQITRSGTLNVTEADSDTPLIIGSRGDLFTKMKGDIAEILIYDRALTPEERVSVVSYLGIKYGLANNLPTVALTAAPAGPAHTAGDTLTLTANAADSDGSIASVSFYANGSLIGTATAPPFTLRVTLDSPGSYSFTAKATDNRNGSTDSTLVARTAAGGAAPVLAVTSSLQLWLKADAGVTTGAGDTVLSWNDQSGKDNHAVATDEFTAPVVAAAAVNQLPAIRFDGLDDSLVVADSPSVSITGDITSFFVLKMDDFDGFRGVWGKTAGPLSNLPAPTDYYAVTGTGMPRVFRGDGNLALGSLDAARPFNAGLYDMAGFSAAGTSVTHYLNGLPNGTGTILAAPADSDTPLYIGTRHDQVTRMKGDIAELLIYDTALSAADLRSVQRYLGQRYGVPLTTPVNDAPAVAITAPAAGGSVVAPADVTISANAADADGSIVKVEFLVNGGLAATDTTAPFSAVVNFPAASAATLVARATDNLGAVTLSAPVAFTATTAEPIPLPSVANLRLWLRADKGVTNTAGAVSNWDDQSGNFNNTTQPLPGQRPVFVADAVNGKPALRFDGNDDSLAAASSPSLAITGDISSFFVVKFDDYATFRAVWAKTQVNFPASTDFYTLPDTGVPQVFRGNGAGGAPSLAAQAANPGEFAIIGFDMAGTSLTHSLNGGWNGAGQITAALADTGAPLYIGTRGDQFTRMKGDIAEVIIYDRSLSEPDKAAVYAYLGTRYGIPLAAGAPALSIVRNGDGTVTVSWPVESTGWGLESTTDTQDIWNPVFEAVNNSLTETYDGRKFYRLRRQ